MNRGFRGFRCTQSLTGPIYASPAIRRPRCRLTVPFRLNCRCRSARPVADTGVGSRPPLAPAHNRSAGPVPARKTRHGEPCNLALFSETGFLALSVPSFHRIRNRQKNGRFLGLRDGHNYGAPTSSHIRLASSWASSTCWEESSSTRRSLAFTASSFPLPAAIESHASARI